MKHFELKGTTRKVGNKAVIKAFRREGLVPCNLYGLGMENTLFTVNAKELKALTDTPNAYIVDLFLDDAKKAQTCVLHELQWHPVTDECLHVDFLAVGDKKPVTISVPLVIEGHAKGVQQGGKFYQNVRSLKISALMKDLPDELTIDITSLGLDKRIKASDVQVKNVTVVSDKDTIICGVKTTRNVTAAASED